MATTDATTDEANRNQPDRTAELWVRSFSPAGLESEHRDVYERLSALEATGAFEDVVVRTWSKEVGLSTTAARSERAGIVLDRVAAFRAWADERGVSIEPFFGTRETTSAVTGERYVARTLPVRALAEYRDGDLCHVAPHAQDGRSLTVGDRLDRIGAAGPADGEREAIQGEP